MVLRIPILLALSRASVYADRCTLFCVPGPTSVQTSASQCRVISWCLFGLWFLGSHQWWKTGGSYSHRNIQTYPCTKHFLLAAGCAHSHRVSSLQICWQHAALACPFRTALTVASAAPGPEVGTILAASYQFYLPQQFLSPLYSSSTPFTVPQWERIASHSQYVLLL